jgi:hypothetical protein
MENKIYCGNGKSFGQYGSVGVSICLDKISPEYISTGKDGKKYISVNVNPNKNGVDQYGKTHNVTVNTWKPNQQQSPQQSQDIGFTEVPDSGVPF